MCYEAEPITDVSIHPSGLCLTTVAGPDAAVAQRVVHWRDLTLARDGGDGVVVLTWPGGEGTYPAGPARLDKHVVAALPEAQQAAAWEAHDAAWGYALAEADRMYAAILAAWRAWAGRVLARYADARELGAGDTIDDGFGMTCSVVCPDCGGRTMEVVRPGKVQCSRCG
jgi:hypothetical protein